MEKFSIKDGRIFDENGYKLPIAKVREILTAAVHTQQKAPLEERQRIFAKLVEAWSHKHPGTYPASFYRYFIDIWTRTNEIKGTEEMRIELAEKEGGKTFTFQLSGRMRTVWKNLTIEQRNEMVALDEKEKNLPKQGSLL